jgi:hypothetical protein
MSQSRLQAPLSASIIFSHSSCFLSASRCVSSKTARSKFCFGEEEMLRENSLESFGSIPSTATPKSSHRYGRSLSPARSMSYCDFDSHPDPIYRQAMKKLSEGCSRFSKERDGMLLTVSLIIFICFFPHRSSGI